MTENGQFLSVPDFRENATEADYQELYNFYQTGTKNFPTRKEPRLECRFQFGATAAKNLLDEWKQRKKNAMEEKPGMEKDSTNGTTLKFSEVKLDFTKRSLQITEDHWNRLQKVFDKYPVINKNYVLQAILEDTLARLDA